ncbi:MAG TPA: chloride channel protein [Longilinea sp.]|nr:chloride channel protein [Longilinea sp.]
MEVVSHITEGARTLRKQFWASETLVLVTFAIIVGIGSGLGTIVFVRMISFFNNIFTGGGKLLGLPGTTYVILLPVLGGLIVGPIIHFIAPEAKGHGVPEVLTAIATKGGRIRPVVVLAKALGSAITIGSGGSVGREGPIVQIGSALGSTIGQVFKLNEHRVINLVASGAAAGIAATFNAPIAGVMFALEVILGDFGFQNLTTMVVAAVTASVVSRSVLGNTPAFAVPAYNLNSPWELPLYIGLGIVAGFGAMAFVRTLYFMEDIFDNWKFPPYLKPAVGGLGLGILGYFVPRIFGIGFDTITSALTGQLGLGLLIILIIGKILATTLTLGSGASGGVFAPALFIGAVLGGAYGQLMQMAFPGLQISSGAYAMVGMAAVFAGAARAPITAVIILFEMTQDYRIILPLMFATVVSTIIAQHIEPESIYTLKLKLRGIDIRAKRDENLLQTVKVSDAMTPAAEVLPVKPNTTLTELTNMFQETGHHGFIVLDDRNKLYGIVTLSDLERAAVSTSTQKGLIVSDICTRNVLTVFPDETLGEALRYFGATDIGRIPVVDRDDPKILRGVLRRPDIVRALSLKLVEKQQRVQHIDRMRLESLIQTELLEHQITSADWASGKLLREIPLPNDCVIVSIHRGAKMIVPRGYTRLLAGDRLDCFVGNCGAEALRKALHEEPSKKPKKKALNLDKGDAEKPCE